MGLSSIGCVPCFVFTKTHSYFKFLSSKRLFFDFWKKKFNRVRVTRFWYSKEKTRQKRWEDRSSVDSSAGVVRGWTIKFREWSVVEIWWFLVRQQFLGFSLTWFYVRLNGHVGFNKPRESYFLGNVIKNSWEHVLRKGSWYSQKRSMLIFWSVYPLLSFSIVSYSLISLVIMVNGCEMMRLRSLQGLLMPFVSWIEIQLYRVG